MIQLYFDSYKSSTDSNITVSYIYIAAILKFFFYYFFSNITKYDCAQFQVKSIFPSVFTQGMIT